jgi:Fe-S-cluster containining protein
MSAEVSACAGQCCAVFPWTTPPDKMRELWENTPRADWEVDGLNGLDCLMIADMLIPLTPEEADERCERFGINPDFPRLCHEDGINQLYTCKNWDEETRLCTKYAARPDMCAAYPYEAACFHCKVEGGCKNGPGWRKNAGDSEIC